MLRTQSTKRVFSSVLETSKMRAAVIVSALIAASFAAPLADVQGLLKCMFTSDTQYTWTYHVL